MHKNKIHVHNLLISFPINMQQVIDRRVTYLYIIAFCFDILNKIMNLRNSHIQSREKFTYKTFLIQHFCLISKFSAISSLVLEHIFDIYEYL